MIPSLPNPHSNPARPFLKWAGGKTQLLPQIEASLPADLRLGQIDTYIEPFIGGGALFFFLTQNFSFEHCFLSDQNPELVSAYLAVQQTPDEVIAHLNQVERAYHAFPLPEQKTFFYRVRADFNHSRTPGRVAVDPTRTAHLIFLNRTCYNGLFRVNSHGAFNVPFGRYRNPTICDAANLRAAAAALQRAEIFFGDFESSRAFVDARTFVYFDPPYRPLSKTASFNAYASQSFDEAAQARLARYYRELHRRGAKLMLSNSDPHNTDPADDFFERHYTGFHIHKVRAKRAINSRGAKRGEITELLITNYPC